MIRAVVATVIDLATEHFQCEDGEEIADDGVRHVFKVFVVGEPPAAAETTGGGHL